MISDSSSASRHRAECVTWTSHSMRANIAPMDHTFPDWEELYRTGAIEKLPWYWPAIDPDLDAALARHGVTGGAMLDQGTGPGTQAIALAARGFNVTATDLSAAAIAYASKRAEQNGVSVTFAQDDILATKLRGPFDAAFDRGCFHVISPERRSQYAKTLHNLIRPGGWLFLKTFSHLQPGTQGPYRLHPDDIHQVFDGTFDVAEILDCVYQGQLDPQPKALFASLRRK